MELCKYIDNPEGLNHDTLYELRSLLARYPYYQAARLLFLQNLYLLHDSSFGEELRKAALYVADCRALFQLIEGKNYEIKPHERSLSEEADLQNSDRTLSLIDKFLNGLPADSDHKPVAVNPTTDYTSYLLQFDDITLETGSQSEMTNREDDLIQNFIDSHPLAEHIELDYSPATEESTAANTNPSVDEQLNENVAGDDADLTDDNCLTETLARIYIKQRRYSKALEIIRRLNLKNPKKSAYFADQMRFLEKLIINNKKL